MELSDRVAVVTGAASGVGLALAAELVSRGAHVALLDLDAGRVEAAARSLGGPHARALGLVADVRDPQAVGEAARAIERELGAVDLLFLNAGVAAVGSALSAPMSDVRWVFDVNVLGTLVVAQAFVPAMVARRSGRVAITASIAGLIGPPGMAVYSASKFALMGLSQSLRIELSGSGVTLTSVCPGQVRTGLHAATRYGDARFAAFLERPMARRFALEPRDVARRAVDATLAGRTEVVMGPERAAVWLERLSSRAYVAAAGQAARVLGLVAPRPPRDA